MPQLQLIPTQPMMQEAYSVELSLEAYGGLYEWLDANQCHNKIKEIALRYPRLQAEDFCVVVTTSDRTTALMLKLALG